MTHFIELTTPQGQKFLANVSLIHRIVDSQSDNPNGNTYIIGLSQPAGIYVRESYEDIQIALRQDLRLHEPIIKL
jgi:hypothetical protein